MYYLNRANNELDEALSSALWSRFGDHEKGVESRSIPVQFQDGGFGSFEEIDEGGICLEKIFRIFQDDVAERRLFRPFFDKFIEFLQHVRVDVEDGADVSKDEFDFGGVENSASGLRFVLQFFLEICDRPQNAYIILLRLQKFLRNHLTLGH